MWRHICSPEAALKRVGGGGESSSYIDKLQLPQVLNTLQCAIAIGQKVGQVLVQAEAIQPRGERSASITAQCFHLQPGGRRYKSSESRTGIVYPPFKIETDQLSHSGASAQVQKHFSYILIGPEVTFFLAGISTPPSYVHAWHKFFLFSDFFMSFVDSSPPLPSVSHKS